MPEHRITFEPAAVSSLAEVLGRHVGGLTQVPATDLNWWLPDLVVPHGWDAEADERSAVTRMLRRRIHGSAQWDACEVLNLYRVPGVIPDGLVLENADRTLRDSGAEGVRVDRVVIPDHYGVTAVTASGLLHIGPRRVVANYIHYAINTAAGGALIEQTILLTEDTYHQLSEEASVLVNDVCRALLTSLDRAVPAPATHIPRDVRAPGTPPQHPEAARPPMHNQSAPSEIARTMSVIRVNFLPEFHFGDDAVLLTLDGPGVDQFSAAVVSAQQHGWATLEHDGVTHQISIEPGAADIELSPTHVVWRLDSAKAAEIATGLTALGGAAATDQPGHVYVDLSSPADTLVVSRDEYVDTAFPWLMPA